MIASFVRSRLHQVIRMSEQMLGVESEHMHFIIDTSIRSSVELLAILKLAANRRKIPSDVIHVARIVATQNVDCGTCVQFNVNVALREGMRPEWIEATLEHQPEALPPELRDVYEFTLHLLRHTYQENDLREAIRARYGDGGLVDLAYAIACAQVMPLTKQALGYAQSCSKINVKVEGARTRVPRRDALSTSAA